ncbi:MAG: lipid-A-disaccharide synthase [Methylobacteriaceae bacterium]|jgi:lipid-A-disaccharide synthase|nr:lipid-A-disaccharide synthase [Methylobacteriaceae bacterium]
MNAPVLVTGRFRPALDRELRVFLIAGEPSGDMLGAKLMRALANRAGRVRFAGTGGPAMEAQGLTSLLPLSEISLVGILPVLKRLPQLIGSIWKVADAVIAAEPDILIIIDSPDFTHRVARRVRRARPNLPIVNYVSPSVWAWRPGRAERMRGYVDHVVALLPFEPAEYERLGGPDCTYVGHPLVEQIGDLRANADESQLRETIPSTLVVMPGSRESEIRWLMPVFGSALARLKDAFPVQIVLPTLPHLEHLVRAEARTWQVDPRVITDTDEKHATMRRARAALVASGSATLELALARVPMVVAYRVSLIEELIARLMLCTDKIALPNLVLGKDAVPECLQGDCSARRLVEALRPLLAGGVERDAQLSAFEGLVSLMNVDARQSPSDKAAEIVERIAINPPR